MPQEDNTLTFHPEPEQRFRCLSEALLEIGRLQQVIAGYERAEDQRRFEDQMRQRTTE